MAEIIIFPLVLRSPIRIIRSDDLADTVVAFPYSRRRHLVERHARALRAFSDEEGDAYLTRVLEQICRDLTALGIDCHDCQCDVIADFATAIGRELHGPDFDLKVEGSAE